MHRAMDAVTGHARFDPPWQFATEREVAALVLQPAGFDKDTHRKLDVLFDGGFDCEGGLLVKYEEDGRVRECQALRNDFAILASLVSYPSPIGLRAIMVEGPLTSQLRTSFPENRESHLPKEKRHLTEEQITSDTAPYISVGSPDECFQVARCPHKVENRCRVDWFE